MGYYYRKDIGFLHTDVHKNIPVDAHHISDLYHKFLMEKQKLGDVRIGTTEDGYPIPYEISVDENTEAVDLWYRQERNKILKSTDWTQLPDVPEDKKLAYQEYRQALRDLPEQENYPNNVIWPKPPE